jgi:hypothetical protein
MTLALGAVLVAAVLALAPASAGAGGGRKPVALTAAPAHVELAGTARGAVRVTNGGNERVVVDVARAGFALSLRGRPRIVRGREARSAAAWLRLQPTSLVLPPRTSATLVVGSTVPRGAAPGDHDALVLLTSRPRAGARVAVRVRLGVVVVVRAPGRIVRRLQLRGLRVVRGRAARVLELGVVNAGDVTEPLAGVRSIVARVTGRRLATLRAARRELRPHTRGLVEFPLGRLLHGAVQARVVVPAVPGRRVIERTYRLRL